MGVFLLPMVTSNNDDMPDMDNVANKFNENHETSGSVMNFTSKDTVSSYERRMMDVFVDIYDLGYLNDM